jgi:glycosyltransferase involved in cell wall biosynthesis
MRIVYDHQVFSLQDAGGASRYHYQLARHLSLLQDISISAALGLNSNVYPFKSLRRNGNTIFSLNTRMRPGIGRYVLNEVITGAWALTSGIWDVYHPSLYRAMPSVRAKALVVTHHDCTHERFPELFRDVRRILRAKRRLFSSADAIICVSKSSQDDLLQFYSIDSRKTTVVHHGHEPIIGHSDLSLPSASLPSRPYLLFVGSRFGYKNFRSFLHAYADARLNQQYDVVAVGGGEWQQQEEMLLSSLDIAAHVTLIPVVDDSMLAEAYARAALLVYPSRYEGFGFPPLEAMSAGCVTAVARTSSLPEVCGDAAFYFNPLDPSSIASTLTEALNSNERAAKVQAGFDVTRRFSWTDCANKTLDIYKSSC